MDIVHFLKGENWLYIIHVTSRKVFTYWMENANSETVLKYFTKWYYQGKELQPDREKYARYVTSILFDQDSAFRFKGVHYFLSSKAIKQYMKDENEHNILKLLDKSVASIKNYLYKKLADIRFPPRFLIDSFDKVVQMVVKDYNNKPHVSLNNYTPNEIFYNPRLQQKLYDSTSDRNKRKK